MNTKRKVILIALIALMSQVAFAKSKTLKGSVISGKDTIRCEIFVKTGFKKRLEQNYFTKKVSILKDDVKTKYKPHQIDAFIISSPTEGELKFVSLSGDKQNFYREIIKGRISYYNFCATIDYTTSYLPVVVKNDKIIFLNVMNSKQRLAKLLIDYPELHSDWINKYSNKDRIEVIRKYNKHFLK
ncbi:hypothetical protein [Labilibaculum sp.]|uniref:hypothetical protein n=1 Tax=Labilibaculum sp. TaxID=2060723 RepID=UPI002AA5E51E|nr:hypothetical protein [Labilibaculum sp.]